MAGQIYTAVTSNALTADFRFAASNTYPPLLGHGVPICVLQPGWSFFLQTNGTSSSDLPTSIIWQALHPEDLQYKPCKICDRSAET